MTAPPDPPSLASPPASLAPRPSSRLARTLASLSLLSAGFLAGLVLLVYPCLSAWEDNFFSSFLPSWNSGFLRGAFAGLGAVTLALALSSMVRIRRRRP